LEIWLAMIGVTCRAAVDNTNVCSQFIRHLKIPYCSLYDLGYTSLGGTTDTHPNPVLKAHGDASEEMSSQEYRPAYELVDDEEERLGRDK
jgi:FAD synthetase